jgi:hypothetical protein
MRATFLLSLGLLLSPGAAAQDSGPIAVPEGEDLAVVDTIGNLDSVTAIAVSPDGNRAAVARLLSEQPERSVIDLHAVGQEPRSVEVGARFPSLLFAADGDTVLGLQRHTPRKRKIGETQIVSIDFARGKVRRLMRAPPASSALASWPARNSLLVSGPDEIRSYSFPDLRSGPLFRISGTNAAIAVLGYGTTIVVGQPDGLALVDLDDRPGPDAMPLRGWLPTAAPVVALAASRDGTGALARLADGAVLRVEASPFTTQPAGTAVALASLPPGTGPGETPSRPPPTSTAAAAVASQPQPADEFPEDTVPATAEPTPSESSAPTAPDAAGEPSAATTVPETTPVAPSEGNATSGASAGAAAVAAGAAEGDSDSEPVPPVVPTAVAPASDAGTETPKEAPAATEPAPAAPERDSPEIPPDRGVLRGRFEGAAADHVREVVLFGPNNIVREARRVTPEADGTWKAENLVPGRYRVQLDGGGSIVLVSDPPFATAVVTGGETVDTPVMRVPRTL